MNRSSGDGKTPGFRQRGRLLEYGLGVFGGLTLLLVVGTFLAFTTPLYGKGIGPFDELRAMIGVSATCGQLEEQDLSEMLEGSGNRHWPYLKVVGQCGVLNGMTREEVHAQLGRPYERDSRVSMWTARQTGNLATAGMTGTVTYLTVEFDRDDLVESVHTDFSHATS